jgi:hypothetical protein
MSIKTARVLVIICILLLLIVIGLQMDTAQAPLSWDVLPTNIQPNPVENQNIAWETPTITNTWTIFYIDTETEDGVIWCGDGLIPVAVPYNATNLTTSLTDLYTALLSDTGLPSWAYQSISSWLTLGSVVASWSVVAIDIIGTLTIWWACDIPRVLAQLNQITLQFPEIATSTFTINGQDIVDYLSTQ